MDSFLGEELILLPEQLWPSPTSFTLCLTTHLDTQDWAQALNPQLFAADWVMAPLIIQSGVWGSLMITKKASELDAWILAKTDLLELISRQLSLAIQQNLLYRQ